MKIVILIILLIGSNSWGFLKVNPLQRNPPSQDTFIGYQWAIFNNSQIAVSDLDDIHPLETPLLPGLSLGWENFDGLMKRDIIVAVLDSGIDTAHPDLKNHLLPGKSFIEKDPARNRLYDDDVGHGTHVAGIMAASMNNSEGIAGLSNRIKILPLKVYDKRELNSRGNRFPLPERIAQAIEFAVEQKADVINLSLGWPRIANTEKVRAAFKRAFEAGVVIVAAAGNDHHDGMIFPCAFREVICVASYGLDGKLSDFSNFGAHVDLAAPGQEILSTYPMTMIDNQFGPRGYELKSGTSQAAPMVAATAAILKGIHPEEAPGQIKNRILAGAQNAPGLGVLFGLLDIRKALASSAAPLMAPDFKEIEMAMVSESDLEFQIPLHFKSARPAPDTIRVDSLSTGIKLKLVKDGAELLIKGKIESLDVSAKLHFTISIGDRIYSHHITLLRDLDKAPHRSYPIADVEMIREHGLSTVRDLTLGSALRYWSWKKEKDKVLVVLYIDKQGHLEKKSVELVGISEPQVNFGLIANDWKQDGSTTFLFAGLSRNEKGEAESVRYFYLSEDLNLLHTLTLKYEGVLPVTVGLRDLMTGRMDVPGLGPLLVPVFWSEGFIPAADKNPNPFAFEVNQSLRRLYFFEPRFENKNWIFVTRSITAGALTDFMTKMFSLDATQDIDWLGTLVQSKAEVAAGELRLLLRVGRGVTGRLIQLSINSLNNPWQKEGVNVLQSIKVDLDRQIFTEAWDLKSATLDLETNIQALYSQNAGRSLLIRQGQIGGFNITLPLSTEGLVQFLKTFTRENEMVSFLETTDALRVQGQWDGKKIDSQIPIYRSSILPGELFRQSLIPVVAMSTRRPAMMVDNSQLFAPSVTTYLLNEQGVLENPVKFTYFIPEKCVRRDLQISKDGFHRLAYLCDRESHFELLFHDLR